MFVDSLFFLLPTVHIREQMGPNPLIWLDIPIFAFASLSHAYFFLSSQSRLYGMMVDKLFIMSTLLATSIGLGVNNGRAVIEALVGYKTGFARTPKSGDGVSKDSLYKSYQANSQNWATYFELVLGSVYFGFLLWAVAQAYWIVVPFLSLFALGFFFTGVSSFKQSRAQAIQKRPVVPSGIETTAPAFEPSNGLVVAE